MSKIQLTDTTLDVFVKMSEGNPEALNAMMNMMQNAETIDPQGAMGGLGAILLFDTWGIYGTDIDILYNDQCNRDVRELLMLMRASQMGLFSSDRLKQIASDQMGRNLLKQEELDELNEKVCAQLSEFLSRDDWKERQNTA